MTSVVDVWRVIDPEARLISGSADRLTAAVRAVGRTHALPPHLPPPAEGQLLVMDVGLAPSSLDALLDILGEAGARPPAVVLAGTHADGQDQEASGDRLPILRSRRDLGSLADAALRYLEEPERDLRRIGREVRLAAAEAALADPSPGTPAGLIAARLRRGVAVSVDGALISLNPRPAGRALAARFTAIHARVLATSPGRSSARRTRDGMHLLERRIRPGASVWLFDDLPFARVDEVVAEALTVTLRALLARPVQQASAPRPPAHAAPAPDPGATMPAADRLTETLLAVARANGRVAPAARLLGVHRNTVLYRLRRGAAERGVDPRDPADALRLIREADERARHG